MLTQQSMIHGKYHGNTGYLLGNVDTGIQEFTGMGYHVDDMQTMRTDELQMMMSRVFCMLRMMTWHNLLLWPIMHDLNFWCTINI